MHINSLMFIEKNQVSLQPILNLIPLPIFVMNSNGKCVLSNSAFENILGKSFTQIFNQEIFSIFPKNIADCFAENDKAFFSGNNDQGFEGEFTDANGKKFIFEFQRKMITDNHGSPSGYLCTLSDITERKALEKILAFQALTDDLTQLPNRRQGLIRLEQVLSESARKKRYFCLALLDIDDFSDISRAYGTSASNEVLVTVANILRSSLRDYDIVARYGIEEFLVCLPETSIDNGLDVLDRLRRTCESRGSIEFNNQQLKVTLSIGLTEFPAQGKTIPTLLQASDQALYQAKDLGKNKVMYCGNYTRN